MNNETLSLIAKFTTRARKLFGPVDLQQFTENENYREGVFNQAEIKTDEELLTLSLLLRIAFDKTKSVNLPTSAVAASTLSSAFAAEETNDPEIQSILKPLTVDATGRSFLPTV